MEPRRRFCPAAPRKQDWVPAIWRCDVPEHLRLQHSEYASPQQPEGIQLPFAVWQSMEVSREEELALDVKEFLIPRKFAQLAPAVAMQSSEGESLKCPLGTQSASGKGSKRRATG
ncbi:hypothetical protein B0H14DRAFT_2567856 [Mycena olivaceomarginata]|nr:hypothetical protein B0H14DRAFT_2567856 [Mycena olivaceomarginata]